MQRQNNVVGNKLLYCIHMSVVCVVRYFQPADFFIGSRWNLFQMIFSRIKIKLAIKF